MMKIKKVIRYVLLVLTGLLLISALLYHELISYGIAQLRGQMHIIQNAKPIEEVLADPTCPDSIRSKLLLIAEIRKFAIDSLGLKDSKNYSTFYDQQGKPVLWVLTACEAFSMKPYQWKFPFLGAVSYKGFFIRDNGIPEQNRLKAEGYDTEFSPTGGWSTLGWFRDPVLSNMLRRNEGNLAELIIHELTHSTVYLPGSVDYNENLATFIGEQGALRFLRSKYGSESEELKKYTGRQKDEEVYGDYMVNACKQLDSLYSSMAKDQDIQKMQLQKYFFIKDLILGINQLPLNYPERYRFEFPGDHLPNNAWFMGFYRYRSSQSTFQRDLLALRGDLKLFVKQIVASVK
ncbi:aminopeptidase [soil metagenome]